MDQWVDAGEESEGAGNFLGQLPAIFWQRKWWIIIPTIVGAVVALAAVILIPPTYRSNAIMLVESPQLPKEVIGIEAGGDVIDRRIAAIQQQITARPDLIELIERHGLYASERKRKPLSEILEQMRSSISLTPTQSSGQASRPDQRTIAFELAFEYSQPAQTQAVAQDLMDRILQLDARANSDQATNTVQFLSDQATALEAQITGLQSQIATVNAQNGNVLASGGMMIGSGSGSYDVQIAALQRDNQSLLLQRNNAQTSDERDPVVIAAEQRLASVRAVYAETHPDVVIAKQALAEAKRLAKDNTQKLPLQSIDEQIAFNNTQIASLRAAKAQENAQVSSRLAAQSRAPLVQQQLGELQQRLATVNSQYEQVQKQLMSAKAGVRAEDEQMAERLSVIEPPVIPDRPSWPNRIILAVAGFGGGLALGFVLAFAIELFLRPIRDPGALKSILGVSPLGVVPFIELTRVPARGWRRLLPSKRR